MIKLLAVGDIHLGRRPSRLPKELENRADFLGSAGAWKRIVELAIREHVNVLALAGDVVENENDFFEGYRELHAGVSKLIDAGVNVLGVAGNHDVLVLPRLADQIGGFKLLGREGNWEAFNIEIEGANLTLWGCSFTKSRMNKSPLAGIRLDRGPGFNIGILHCDLNRQVSNYAPVTSNELKNTGFDGWLLGHIHKPDKLTHSYPFGYLGSITNLDPGEPGVRGPWLLTIDGGKIQGMDQWMIAPLRWEYLDIDITDLTQIEDVKEKLLDELKYLDRSILSSSILPPEAVGLRINFIGRGNIGEPAKKLISAEDVDNIYSGDEDTHYFINRIDIFTQPAISIEKLAERNDPPGLLARKLMLLDQPKDNPERQNLISKTSMLLNNFSKDQRWNRLSPETKSFSEDKVVSLLRTSGFRLLEKIFDQRENP
jgi:DNA repair protein SbcD/Mre11